MALAFDVATRRGSTVAVVGQQELLFAVPQGGRLELSPLKDGRVQITSVSAAELPIAEANVPSDSDPFPVTVGKGQHLE